MPEEFDTGLLSEQFLSDEQLRAIGCVAVESTYLEHLLDMVIERMCGLDEHDFRVLIGAAPIGTKLNIARDVTEARVKPELADQHKSIFHDLSNQLSLRNNVIHGRWSVKGPLHGHSSNLGGNKGWSKTQWIRGESFAIRANRGKAGHTEFKTKDIMAIARGLDRARKALADFLQGNDLFPPRVVRSPARPPDRK